MNFLENFTFIKKFTLVFFVFFSTLIIGQETQKDLKGDKITLEQLLKVASKKSLDAFKAQSKYEYSYWQFRSFKASLLPSITFESNPLTYKSSVVERYDSELNQDVYRPVRSLNSYTGLSLSQNISQTGGRISLNSTYNKLTNYTDGVVNRFNVTPVNLSLYQPIMAFNKFKWLKRTAPLKYDLARKQLIYELQIINVKVVGYFFKWLLAFKREEIAEEKAKATKKLFEIAKQRYGRGSIEKSDVLNLELEVYNADIDVSSLKNDLVQAKNDLNFFLREDFSTSATPIFTNELLDLNIDMDHALNLYKNNNPKVLDLAIKKIEAERDLDKAIKENRFDLSLSGSYGFNQQAENFSQAYDNLLEQQRVSIKFKIPILDWGERKGNIKTAKRNKEVQDIDLELEESSLLQDLQAKISQFNLQQKLVYGSLRASEISKESFELTEKRFLSGNVDLLRLTSSLRAWQKANESYIIKLSNYWKFFYEIQQYTLYNYIDKRELKVNFEKGILN